MANFSRIQNSLRIFTEQGEKIRNKSLDFDNDYLISKKAVNDVASTGRICLLDVDKQGVKNIRQTDLSAVFIYISPPSYEILEQRLRGRQTENESAIEKRLKEAKESMEFSKEPGMYDHVVLNDQLDVAYQQLKQILHEVNTFLSSSMRWIDVFFRLLKDIELVLAQQQANMWNSSSWSSSILPKSPLGLFPRLTL